MYYFGIVDGVWKLDELLNIIEEKREILKTKTNLLFDIFKDEFDEIYEVVENYIERIDFFGYDSIGIESEEVQEDSKIIAVLIVGLDLTAKLNKC